MPSETMELLQLARAAWDSGRLSESWRLMAMIEVDCEYDRCSYKQISTRWMSRLRRAESLNRDWLAWSDESPSVFTASRDVFYDSVTFDSQWFAMNPTNYARLRELTESVRITPPRRPAQTQADEWPDVSKYFERWAKVRIQYPTSLQFMDGV